MVTIIKSTSTISCCDLKSRRERILRRGSHRGRNLRHGVSRLAPRGSFFLFSFILFRAHNYCMNGLYDSGISRRHMILVTGAREWIFIFLSFFLFFFFRFFVCLLHSTGSKLGRHLRNLSRHLSCMYIYTFFLYIHIRIYSF